jgi:hypothetical protein
MRLRQGSIFRHIAGLMCGALVAPPAFAETTEAAPAALPVVLGVAVFVLVIAFGLGRHAWALRRDFVRMLATSPEKGVALFKDAPGGLPEGSVRAVIALAIVLVTLPALVLSRVLGLGSTGELGTILGGVLGYYFGARGGNDTEARRQAETARGAQQEAEREAAEYRRTAETATVDADGRMRQAGAAAALLPGLAGRAEQAAAAARAIAALLPAGPAGALRQVGDTAEAVSRAIADPSTAHLAAAVEAATMALREAGEGTDLATRLDASLQAVRAAAGALGAVRAAVADPTPERIAEALAGAARLAGTPEGGLAGALAPALGVLGSAMRVPGLAAALGVAGPAGVATAVLLGAFEASRVGRAHYQRWVARVLDRPVSRDLFPAGEWDGEAARALIVEEPMLATALAARIGPDAPQDAAAAALRDLLEPGAGARLFAAAPDGFASPAEAEAAVARLRQRLLERELDRADARPVMLGGDVAMPQARLRADLDLLREAGAGEAIDTLVLLAEGVIAARPAGDAGLDVPALLRGAVAAATGPARALERDPRPLMAHTLAMEDAA